MPTRPQVIRDLPVADLSDEPEADGQQPVPAAPRTPIVITRAAPRPSSPPTISQEGQVIPADPPPVQEVPHTTEDLFRAVVEPRPEPQNQAALPMPQVQRRVWPLVVLPLLIGAVISLAWFQPPKWQAQFQQEVVQPPAALPDPDAGKPDEPPLQPDPTPPAEPAAGVAPAPSPVAAEPAAAGPPAVVEPPPPAASSPSIESAGPPAPMFQWVVLRPRAASSGGQAEAARIATILQPLAARLESQSVQESFRAPTIRYFRPDDAAAAQSLAALLPRTGTPWRIVNATTQRGAAPGKLEVWPTGP